MECHFLRNILAIIVLLIPSNTLAKRKTNPLSHGTNESLAVKQLRSYLRINTAHPTPEKGYEEAIEFFRNEAKEIGLDFNLLDLGELGAPHQFALWLTWNGTNPSLKSLLFNSHMDVVPAQPDNWLYGPYEAEMDDKGNIYGRGASDMKSTTMAVIAAIRKLKRSGFNPLRTIHISIMPDEEMEGENGMAPFVKTDHFAKLNVGVDIDEGMASESDTLYVSYAEKVIWDFNITARGKSGHGSLLPKYTAGQRLQVAINKLLEFRESQYRKMEEQNVSLEHVTALNLVMLGGGIADNIIPSELWASFDMRLWFTPKWGPTDAANMLENIVKEANLGSHTNDVSIKFIYKSKSAERTDITNSNVWWTELKKSCRQMKVKCEPRVLSGGTDGRFVRELGIPVLGFSAFTKTPNTMHRENEFINQVQLLEGVHRYTLLIKNLAMVPEDMHR